MKRILREQKETNKTLKQLSSNIKHVETIVADLQERMTVIENERGLWKECAEKMVHCEESCKSTMTQVEFLALKVDDLENRSRRNNLIIYGLSESSDEDVRTLEAKVRDDIFKKILGIEIDSIERVHRIGRKQSQRTRPVIIRLFNFAEKTKILSSCFKLKNTQISISEDFSKKVRDTRAKLWRSAVSDKAKGAKVSLAFDKLKINGKTFTWSEHEGRRIEQSKPITSAHAGPTSRDST